MRVTELKAGLKFFALGVALLLLLHYESLSLGPLKVSHLWKFVLLAYLLFRVLRVKSASTGYEYVPLFLLSSLQIINMEALVDPFNAVVSCGTVLLFPLLGVYAKSLSIRELERGLIFFASFCILSFLPYQMGLLSSLREGYDLTTFAGGEEIYGLIGPFQKVHSASAALAFSLLVVLFFLAIGRFSRLYMLGLFIAGSYFLFYTYVRTGMLMLVLGSLPVIFYFAKRSFTSFLQVFLVGALAVSLVVAWVLPNEVLLNKITGERTYYAEDSVETFGSGRIRFALAALDYYSEAAVLEKVFGIGETEGVNRMYQKIGVALFPHNGFLFLLSANGIVGLLLFLAFLYRIFKSIRWGDSVTRPLAASIALAYVTFTFLQSYDLIYAFVFFSFGFALFQIQAGRVDGHSLITSRSV